MVPLETKRRIACPQDTPTLPLGSENEKWKMNTLLSWACPNKRGSWKKAGSLISPKSRLWDTHSTPIFASPWTWCKHQPLPGHHPPLLLSKVGVTRGIHLVQPRTLCPSPQAWCNNWWLPCPSPLPSQAIARAKNTEPMPCTGFTV